ncbi:Hypothetical protein CM240_2558 [Clostridium bornimense]|uniref:Uncharacterized protein n=1 Tax=Clostridium bornimense TaxID=1216932 RepID=W6S5Q7_9CLOT|nr:spore coat protein [Clostridium bornimense]CDM69682.1 Hypothetical protein CM240_2558 [Clostridium bornimense]
MIKIVGDLIKDNVNIDDKLIAESMITAAKDGALLYLNSATTSTTPELRAIYTASVGQMLEGDAALTELSIKKQWVKPSESLINQLQCAFDCANNTVNKKD